MSVPADAGYNVAGVGPSEEVGSEQLLVLDISQ